MAILSEGAMSDKQTYQPWNEGQSTKPDVDALVKAFPPDAIEAGAWQATDAELKAHIGSCAGSRFHTVTEAWRKRLMRDFSVIVYRQMKVGFYCPTPEQVYARTHPTLEFAGRKIGRHLKRVGATKPVNELQRTTQEHHGRLLHASKRDLRKQRMNLVLPAPVTGDPPKIQPPKRRAEASAQ